MNWDRINGEVDAVGSPGPPPSIPDHELICRIGGGAYGEVWLARNVLGSARAVKVVYRDRFQDARPFQRELEGIQHYEPVSRGHEGLIDILQVGRNDEGGYFYCVMELADDFGSEGSAVPGAIEDRPPGRPPRSVPPRNHLAGGDYVSHTLSRELTRRGRLPIGECLRIGMALASALDYLHSRNLVHRDIKPSNVIFVGGTPKLADIGLVADLEESRSFVGTEGFVPPEGPGTVQADLYSLGKLLYEIATGKSRHQFPEPPTELAVSEHPEEWLEFNTVVLRACERDPTQRYASAAELGADLAYLASGRSVRRLRTLEQRLRRFKKTALVGALAAVGLFGTYAIQQRADQDRIATALALERAKVMAQRREMRLTGELEEANAALLFQRAETLFSEDRALSGIALLAHMVRRNPANEVAVERLLSALTYRGFALPATEPLQHRGKVVTACFSPVARRLVTGALDQKARVWDIDTGQPVGMPMIHDQGVSCVVFSPDGRLVATAAWDGCTRVWDLATGQPVFGPLRHAARVNSVQFSPDGRLLVTASDDRTAMLWEAETGRPFSDPLAHRGAVLSASFSADGRRVVTASQDGTARLWEVGVGASSGRRLEHDESVLAAVFSPDSSLVATGSADGMARIWEVATGRPLGDPFKHEGAVRMVRFSPDGGRVVTASDDASAVVWDVRAGRAAAPPLRHSGRVLSAEFGPEGLRVITASADRTARLWDAETGHALCEPMRHDHRVATAHFSPDGLLAVTCSEDGTARLWRVQVGGAMPRQWERGGPLAGADYSPDGRWLAITAEDEATVVRDAATGRLVAGPLKVHAGALGARFSPDGGRLATWHGDGAARIWDWALGSLSNAPLPHAGGKQTIGFSPDGARLATVWPTDTVRVWDVGTGRPVGVPLRHDDEVTSVHFSPGGERLLTASKDGKARIWLVERGELLVPALGHPAELRFASFSPDGRSVATACDDRRVRVWKAGDGLLDHPPMSHNHSVEMLKFSHDGRWLLTVTEDFQAWIWSVAGDPSSAMPLRHAGPIRSVEFSPDDREVLTCSVDGTAALWDRRTGLRLAEPFRHEGPVALACFSPNGGQVATAAADGRCRIWEHPRLPGPAPAWLPDFAEALAGERNDGLWLAESVPVEQLWAARRVGATEATSDVFKNWVAWFFADPGTRPRSPFGNAPINLVQSLDLLDGAGVGLREAVYASPNRSRLLVALAHELLERDRSPRPGVVSAAEGLIARARALSPHDRAVWVRAMHAWNNVQMQFPFRVNEGVEATDRALAAEPDNINLWITRAYLLKFAERPDESRRAYEGALALVLGRGKPTAELRRDLIFNHATLLRCRRRETEAEEAYRTEWNIPARAAQAPARLVDLSEHYNQALEGEWLALATVGDRGLAALPQGRQTLDGVEFDLRGMVQLAGGIHVRNSAPHLPSAVEGVKVGLTCRRLHFLHAYLEQVRAGTMVGHYRIHFADGISTTVPLLAGANIDAQAVSSPDGSPVQARIAWSSQDDFATFRLFRFTWENPHPRVEVRSFDFNSTGQEASPFLVAVTADP